MNKVIIVKNDFISRTSDEKELKIADIIAKLINNNYKGQSLLAK